MKLKDRSVFWFHLSQNVAECYMNLCEQQCVCAKLTRSEKKNCLSDSHCDASFVPGPGCAPVSNWNLLLLLVTFGPMFVYLGRHRYFHPVSETQCVSV